MLPTGHAAAGFITAYSFLKIIKPNLDPLQINQLIYLGAFIGFAPDLDEFWFFLKSRAWLVAPVDQKVNHRHYLSHTPFLWFIVGLVFFIYSSSLYWQLVGILIWLCSWSHFLTDSIENGIMWLWPFKKKLFAFKNREINLTIPERRFIKHSFTFLKLYTHRISFYLEVLLIIFTIIIFQNTNLY